jgi:hypothetical protein
MTIFNRSVYQYLCQNTEKKIFYDKMIKLCYFNPYIETEKKDNYFLINIHSDASKDFYKMINKMQHEKNSKFMSKYSANKQQIISFIETTKHYSNCEMWFSMNLKTPFEYDSDILEYAKNIIEIQKFAVIPENENNNMFIFGHEYYDKKNNIIN